MKITEISIPSLKSDRLARSNQGCRVLSHAEYHEHAAESRFPKRKSQPSDYIVTMKAKRKSFWWKWREYEKNWLQNRDHGYLSHQLQEIDGGNSGNCGWLYFLAEINCSHEVVRDTSILWEEGMRHIVKRFFQAICGCGWPEESWALRCLLEYYQVLLTARESSPSYERPCSFWRTDVRLKTQFF